MTTKETERWLQLIKHYKEDDLKLARHLLHSLTHYREGGSWESDDLEKVFALITAVRCRQILSEPAKEQRRG